MLLSLHKHEFARFEVKQKRLNEDIVVCTGRVIYIMLCSICFLSRWYMFVNSKEMDCFWKLKGCTIETSRSKIFLNERGFFLILEFYFNKEKAVYFVFKLVFEKSKFLWIHSASNIAFMQYIWVSSFTKSTNNEIRYKRRIYLKQLLFFHSFILWIGTHSLGIMRWSLRSGCIQQ